MSVLGLIAFKVVILEHGTRKWRNWRALNFSRAVQNMFTEIVWLFQRLGRLLELPEFVAAKIVPDFQE